jgi:hypothetical protein
MPTLFQLKSWVEQEIRKGHGDCHTNHVVIIEQEAAEKALNPPDETGKRKTRIAWDAGDPDSYAAWHAERERWMIAARKNPVISTDAMLVALRSVSEEAIKVIIENLQEIAAPPAQRTDAPGPPKASLPEWKQPEDSLKR